MFKGNIEICSELLLNIVNFGITNSIFDDGMKLADITPAGSKIFERILQKQMNIFIEKYLSPFLCGYRKGYCAQYVVMTFLEKWRISLSKKGYGGAILMDLSKAFDSLNHE